MSAVPKPVQNQILIFFDLDGVLADFDLHAEQEGKVDSKGKIRYGALDYKWWASMPICDGAQEAYAEAGTLGTTAFLTGPMFNEECYSGKAAWVQRFAKGGLKDLIICPSEKKSYLAGPRRILIDDREKNIQEWQAAGGIGILHTGNFDETMKKLKSAVSGVNAAKPAPRPNILPPGGYI